QPEVGGVLMFYIVTYFLAALLAFSLLMLLETDSITNIHLKDIQGMASYRPGMAVMLAVAIFSLAGLPPLAGFVAKFMIFYHMLEQSRVWPLIIAIFAACLSLFYYLRILVYVYMRPVGNTRLGVK